MKIFSIVTRALILYFPFCLIGSVSRAADASADPVVHVVANANHQQKSFKKFLYSFPIAQPIYIIGFRGELSAKNTRDSFGESLLTFYVLQKGSCPQNGTVLDSYTQIKTRYPGMSQFYVAILKRSTKGEEAFPVSVDLPGGFAASHCVVAVLDGAMPGGGIFFMSADLSIQTTATKPPTNLDTEDFGGEFCFGMNKGCGPNHDTGDDQSYTSFFGFTDRPKKIAAVHGDSSSAAFPPDFVGRYGFDVANGRWSVSDDLYIVNDCRNINRRAMLEIKGFHVPPGSRKVNTVRNDRSGVESGEEPVRLTPSNLVVPAGGCLAHYTQKLGNGGVDTEYQITLWYVAQD